MVIVYGAILLRPIFVHQRDALHVYEKSFADGDAVDIRPASGSMGCVHHRLHQSITAL
jgi:hypothetical protein